jgi:hypothetical protein
VVAPLIQHTDLLALVDYNPETGAFTNKKSRHKSPAGKNIGLQRPDGYLELRLKYRLYLAHRLAWFYVFGKWPEHQIDHVNGVKNDNRIGNLREATGSQNMQNVGRAQSRSRSQVRGVSWDATRNKWTAHICVAGRQKNLGRFDQIEAAAFAYQQARQVLHPFAARKD